jgi:hypothetical protein
MSRGRWPSADSGHPPLLPKPVTPDALLACVDAALEAR